MPASAKPSKKTATPEENIDIEAALQELSAEEVGELSEEMLDIAKVVSVSDTASGCGVVPASMVYVDHQGQTHRVSYQVMGDCSGS